MVMLFWAQKRKLGPRYSSRACEMKSLTSSLLPPLNQNRLCHDIHVFTQTFIFDFNFLLNLPFQLKQKIKGR